MLLLCKVNFIKKYTYLTVRINSYFGEIKFQILLNFFTLWWHFVRCKYETLLTFVKNTANKIHCHAHSAKQRNKSNMIKISGPKTKNWEYTSTFIKIWYQVFFVFFLFNTFQYFNWISNLNFHVQMSNKLL